MDRDLLKKGLEKRRATLGHNYVDKNLMGNGRWVGHPGYVGQFLMVSPEKQAAIAFHSVIESSFGDEDDYHEGSTRCWSG
jgi:hypothetical protein